MFMYKKIIAGHSFEIKNILRMEIISIIPRQWMVNVFVDLSSSVKEARKAVKRVNEVQGLSGDPERVYSQTFQNTAPVHEVKA